MALTWPGFSPPDTFCMPTVLPMSCSIGWLSRKAAAVMSMFSVRPDWQGRRDWLYPIHTCTRSHSTFKTHTGVLLVTGLRDEL